MLIIQILILFILLLIFGAICSGIGFFVGFNKRLKPKAKTVSAPLSDIEKAEKEKREQEIANFWAYDGSVQHDSNT